ncbi:hypothetical protein AGMMS49938_05960 [Fibrobacterales bacterium]|nr:hypothetical protein AGMMS49938_05960 [Fibrobacterales bacterium]
MSIVFGVLAEEKVRLEALIADYEKRLTELPDVSVHTRNINGKFYLYGVHRENGKVVSIYIGPKSGSKAKKAIERDEQRRKYKQRRRIALADLADVGRILGKHTK